MIKDIMKEAEHKMKSAIQAMDNDLSGVRTGRASPALVEHLSVEYYGAETPLIQLATISVPEPRQLLIRPFDPTTLKAIEKAIQSSNLSLAPMNDGKVIRLNLPVLTEERRHELVKIVHTRAEECRIAVRNVRRDLLKDMRDFEHEKMISEDELETGEDELRKLTDKIIEEVDGHSQKKEKDIMEV